MKVLRPYGNGMTQAAVEATSDVLTSGELDDEIENNYDAVRAALPAWTSTRIRYKAGATEAEIWDPGEKPQKIFLPLKDGWYLPDKKYAIPNGQPSNSGNPAARHLCRWQDRDYDGLLARDYYGWSDRGGRYVNAYCRASIQFGVCVRDEKTTAPKPVFKCKCVRGDTGGKICECYQAGQEEKELVCPICKKCILVSDLDDQLDMSYCPRCAIETRDERIASLEAQLKEQTARWEELLERDAKHVDKVASLETALSKRGNVVNIATKEQVEYVQKLEADKERLVKERIRFMQTPEAVLAGQLEEAVTDALKKIRNGKKRGYLGNARKRSIANYQKQIAALTAEKEAAEKRFEDIIKRLCTSEAVLKADKERLVKEKQHLNEVNEALSLTVEDLLDVKERLEKELKSATGSLITFDWGHPKRIAELTRQNKILAAALTKIYGQTTVEEKDYDEATDFLTTIQKIAKKALHDAGIGDTKKPKAGVSE